MKRYDDAQGQSRRITFDDVAGIDEAKGELVEIVDFLKDPRKYTLLGGTVPRGVLLIGPPGTGARDADEQEILNITGLRPAPDAGVLQLPAAA